MTEKKELKEEDIKDVDGGISLPTIYNFKCNNCGHEWSANSIRGGDQCSKCGSSNVKQV